METCFHSNSSERLIANADEKNSKRVNNNNNNNKFDHANKWYMQNPAPVLEHNTHKFQWDFDIHTDHLISARRPDLIIINKRREHAKLSTLLSRLTTE